MLDIKTIRQDPQGSEASLRKKDPSITLGPLLEADSEIRTLKQEIQELQTKRKALSKAMSAPETLQNSALRQEVHTLKDRIHALEKQLLVWEEQFENRLSSLPNFLDPRVRHSFDLSENTILKVVGKKPSFSFPIRNHVELGSLLGLFDFEASAKTTGSHWPWYKGIGAQLEWALLQYMVEIQIKNGFQFMLPPIMVRPEIMYGSGQIPKFVGQFYEVNQDNLYLIPTAEVVLNGMHRDQVLEHLPLLYSAYTPCFRREAGAAGEKERGLIRMHQFNKVEMFAFAKPDQSEEIFNKMLDTAEQILHGLELHFRYCDLVSGDVSFAAARTVDIEVYLPGQERYYEVSSVSHCTTFQSRRSMIRYKEGDGLHFVHTLNGSGLATSRLMVALLENNQCADGSVRLPPVLQTRLQRTHLTPL